MLPPTAFTIGQLTITPLVMGQINDTLGRWFDAALPALPDRPASMPVIFVHVSGPFGRVVQCRGYLPQSGHAWLEKPVNRGFLTR
jgi:hypothetical protein